MDEALLKTYGEWVCHGCRNGIGEVVPYVDHGGHHWHPNCLATYLQHVEPMRELLERAVEFIPDGEPIFQREIREALDMEIPDWLADTPTMQQSEETPE